MINWLTEPEAKRWNDIKTEFAKQQKQKGFGKDNQLAQVLMQLEALTNGLNGIKDVMEKRK